MDAPTTALLDPLAASSSSDLPLAPQPQRPNNSISFMEGQQRQRFGSGANMGYGGYTPTLMQGRYGESVDEDKAEEGWENTSRVGDLRGANWGGGKAKGNNDELDVGLRLPTHEASSSSSSSHSPAHSPSRFYPPSALPAPPVLYPPPPGPPRTQPVTVVAPSPQVSTSPSYAPPSGYQSQVATTVSPRSPAPQINPFADSYTDPNPNPNPNPAASLPPGTTRRGFQLSDPPVTIQHHYPEPSSDSQNTVQSLSMSAYPNSDNGDASYQRSQGGHYGDSSYGSSIGHDQLDQRRGHGIEATDASFYTAADSLESRGGSPPGLT
ncbi:hypothetical protein M422DRAFT_273854 [Sphaerobolus stellatus SS14]|uniref:Uncharacterized protein n=1 Tax=Sphaerobolus stellatus (strain SS14) TaxID=990650 RepID=A0A0C9T878_SPHS4|nr:hypothetical protein M422DRAFT_273854 [Sphaerobolus stellatus SS14]